MLLIKKPYQIDVFELLFSFLYLHIRNEKMLLLFVYGIMNALVFVFLLDASSERNIRKNIPFPFAVCFTFYAFYKYKTNIFIWNVFYKMGKNNLYGFIVCLFPIWVGWIWKVFWKLIHHIGCGEGFRLNQNPTKKHNIWRFFLAAFNPKNFIFLLFSNTHSTVYSMHNNKWINVIDLGMCFWRETQSNQFSS